MKSHAIKGATILYWSLFVVCHASNQMRTVLRFCTKSYKLDDCKYDVKICRRFDCKKPNLLSPLLGFERLLDHSYGFVTLCSNFSLAKRQVRADIDGKPSGL